MPQISKILVPVDFSECSRAALAMAGRLAQSTGATLDVLHVWQVPSFIAPSALVGGVGAPTQPLIDLVRKQAEREMSELVMEANRQGILIGSQRLIHGEPATTIVEESASGGYDLIAMGTHGRTGLQHLLLGSIAEKVVRMAHTPVLTVRHSAESERGAAKS
jgi:universal stress protein A